MTKTLKVCFCDSLNQCYPSILLTAYKDDARVPLSGVLKYTERLKDAVHTHCAANPKSGTFTLALSQIQPPILDPSSILETLQDDTHTCVSGYIAISS